MSSPYSLRPHRGSEQQYTGLDSDSSETMVDGYASSQDPEWNSGVSANESDEMDSSDARRSSSCVLTPAPPMHRAVTSIGAAARITPSRSSTRSVDSNISSLNIGRTVRPQIGSNQTSKNKADADPDYNPLRRAPKRVASAPALQDANGRRQRFEKGLSSESENGDSSRLTSPVVDQKLYNTRFLRRPQITTRLNVEGNDGHSLPSEGMSSVEDASKPESDKENYVNPPLHARAKSPHQDQSYPASQPGRQVEKAPHPEEVPEAAAPAPHVLSSSNVRPELGYGYGYDVAGANVADPPDLGPDEPHFFRDALAAIDARNAYDADDQESSFLRDILAAIEEMPGYETFLGTRSNAGQETGRDDSWMEEIFDFDEFQN